MADDALTLKTVFENNQNFGGTASACPHCGIVTLYQQITATGSQQQSRIKLSDRILVNIYLGRCPHCSGLALGAITSEGNDARAHFLWPLDIWPNRAPTTLESEIRRPYDEARQIVSLSPSGGAVLARRCIQHVIRAKLEIRKRVLFEEIAEAVKREELSKPTRMALDHVREIGNWGAHPIEDAGDPASTIIEVSLPQAQYTLQVLELLFHDLYELPDKISKMNSAIANRK